MRRSTTSAVTDRRRLGLLLLVELIVAVALLAHPVGRTAAIGAAAGRIERARRARTAVDVDAR